MEEQRAEQLGGGQATSHLVSGLHMISPHREFGIPHSMAVLGQSCQVACTTMNSPREPSRDVLYFFNLGLVIKIMSLLSHSWSRQSSRFTKFQKKDTETLSLDLVEGESKSY